MSAREARAVELVPLAGDGSRYFIRLDGRHAGGVAVHSVSGDAFSYGVAVAPDMRRKGAAAGGLELLFGLMRARGFARAVVRVREDNAASLALHEKLGFVRRESAGGVVILEKRLDGGR